MLKFQEGLLKDELGQLSSQARVAFAASCAQRLASVYPVFIAQSGRADGTKLEIALNYVWDNILACPKKEATEHLLAEIMALVPDEDFLRRTPLAAYAEDAVSAVAYCLRCLLSGDAQEAAWAARRIYEALDQFVINRDNISPSVSGAETRILSDAIIQAELKRQARDITDLKTAGSLLSPKFMNSFRQRSVAEQALVLAC